MGRRKGRRAGSLHRGDPNVSTRTRTGWGPGHGGSGQDGVAHPSSLSGLAPVSWTGSSRVNKVIRHIECSPFTPVYREFSLRGLSSMFDHLKESPTPDGVRLT